MDALPAAIGVRAFDRARCGEDIPCPFGRRGFSLGDAAGGFCFERITLKRFPREQK